MLVILYHLSQSPHGFNELQTKMSLNTATLTRRLKELEKEGFINKNVDGLHRTYALSPRGAKLSEMIEKMASV